MFKTSLVKILNAENAVEQRHRGLTNTEGGRARASGGWGRPGWPLIIRVASAVLSDLGVACFLTSGPPSNFTTLAIS
jgi:hypothetical protein